MIARLALLATIPGLLFAGCPTPNTTPGYASNTEKTLSVSSTDFKREGEIPRAFTCEGANESPGLVVFKIPPEAPYLALVMEDPDTATGTKVHWLFWDLPAEESVIERNQNPFRLGATMGENDFGSQTYDGPCPTPGQTHRYFFRVFAEKARIGLSAGTDASALKEALKTSALAWGETWGTFTILPTGSG